MATIETLRDIVRAWAAENPRVSAAYLFGSRLKGTHRKDSDLDVAVKLLNPKGRPGDFCDWAELADELRRSLAERLPVALDLTQYENSQETPTVHAGLLACSIQVYPEDSEAKGGDSK